MDIGHFIQRLNDPFNPESRFYWPLVAAIFLAFVVHTAWYIWKPAKPRHPVRDLIEAPRYEDARRMTAGIVRRVRKVLVQERQLYS